MRPNFVFYLTLLMSTVSTAQDFDSVTDFPITTTEMTISDSDDETILLEKEPDPGVSNISMSSGNKTLDKIELNISENTIATGESVNEVNELETWEAPYEIRKNCPYFLSGYDYDGRPIFISEAGHFNFRKIVIEGPESLKNFDKYVQQAAYRGVKIIREASTPESPITQAVLIIDFADLNIFQFIHLPSLTHVLNMARNYRSLVGEICHMVICVNVNAVASSFIKLVKPIFGGVFERVEVHGTNRARWIPHVLRHCPKNQIPQAYGGLPNFKPLKNYG